MKETFQLNTPDGITLQGYTSNTASNPNAVITLIHGMGEHALRYEHVANFFNQHNIALVSMDHRGHGRSTGKRGHTPNYDALMHDVEMLLQKTNEMYANIPIILYGHSMGGNLVLNFLIRKKPAVKGAIVTAPYLRLAFEPPAWKVKLGKLSAGIIPSLSQPTGLDTKAISRDPEVVSKYEKDPLVHDKITSAFFVNVHFAGPYAIEHAKEIEIPLLLMHGTADRLTSVEGTKEFAAHAGKNVELKIWEGFYHELHNEPEKIEVLEYEINWLKKLGIL
ncbi:MAG: lysophospholipase [Flavobacteriales bacterium]|nr:lysophospholipase [Flavobacteriales bacterium]